jgi:hypothetical protein
VRGVQAALARPVARLAALQPGRQGAEQRRSVPQLRVLQVAAQQRVQRVRVSSAAVRRQQVVHHAVQVLRVLIHSDKMLFGFGAWSRADGATPLLRAAARHGPGKGAWG